jgi:holo-[acyl-carrier protein] synthase
VPEPKLRIRVGVDIVGVERIARLASEHHASLDRVFTPAELEYCAGKRRRNEHLAARFAAKEAVLKAIGTGLRRRMQWTDVEVVRDPSGRPGVRLHGEVAEWARRRGVDSIDVSLSHSAGIAVAEAIAVCSESTEREDREWAA